MALKVPPHALARLAAQPEHIRNICILAHVDHGKTTLTDCLISSNGIISQKLAGKVRYMDSTEEEQLRGITMKSSAITLLHTDEPFRELRVRAAAAAAARGAAAVESAAAAEAAAAAAPMGLASLLEVDGGAGELAAAGEAASGATPSAGGPARVPYLVNLIDSPGHVDFSMDVATAARLCDGALVIVDAAEGVCIQTHAVLRTAWAEGVRPVLVINKLDRLITELQLSPSEAYTHVCRILEQANVLLSEMYMADLMAGMATTSAAAAATASAAAAASLAAAAVAAGKTAAGADGDQELTLDVPSGGGDSGGVTFDATAVDVDERTEAALFFDPTKGNVLFASAIDGWAFTLDDFAGLHCDKLGVPRALLRRALWGDYFYKPKTRSIVTGGAAAAAAKGKPLAVSLVLERLWAVYEATVMQPDEARQAKIVGALGLQIHKRDLIVKDGRMRVQAIMRAWLPLASAVMGVVARKLPSPVEAQRLRVDKLWPAALGGVSGVQGGDGVSPLAPGMPLDARMARVRAAVAACDASPAADCVVYISKMFSVPKASLPDPASVYEQGDGTAGGNAPVFPVAMLPTAAEAWVGTGALEDADSAARESLDLSAVNSSAQRSRAMRAKLTEKRRAAGGGDAARDAGDDAAGPEDEDEDPAATETMIAFARVFSGVLRPDAPVFVLGPRYDPAAPHAGACAHVSQVTRPMPLYMMMGRELFPMREARAGSVIGIGRLSSHVLKTATLCSTPACVSLSPMTFQTTPLVRVAVEPRDPRDLRAVERGLALLNQADACVEVTVADTGELQLSALGELHLDRCIKDLTTRFARCDVVVSAPILSFMETLTEAAKPVPVPAATPGGGGGDGGGGGRRAEASSGDAAGSSGDAATGSGASGGAALEFGRLYGGGSLPWSWTPPDSGVAYHPPTASVVANTMDGGLSLRVRAVPLPEPVTRFLQESAPAIKALAAAQKRMSSGALGPAAPGGGGGAEGEDGVGLGGGAAAAAASAHTLRLFHARLAELCAEAGAPWPAYLRRVWSFGPKRVGPNWLVARLDSGNVAALARALGAEEGEVAAALGSLWRGLGMPEGNDGGEAPRGSAARRRPREQDDAASAAGGEGDAASVASSAHPSTVGGAAGAASASMYAGAAGAPATAASGALSTLRGSLVQGFQLGTAAGPLAGEPLWGVAFVVEEVTLRQATGAAAAAAVAAALAADVAALPGGSEPSSASESGASDAAALLGVSVPAGQAMAIMRDACRMAFQAGTQRLVEAVFKCELQCSGGRGGGNTGEQLGRLYGVLSRRRGRVISEDVREGTQTFEISATLPVVESFGFADDLRKQTSGAATSPQLVFSHWEVLPQDPLFRPSTDDEREEWGDTVHEGQGKNLARVYVDAVRGRKGMPVERKIVAHAEKQRTLSRKK